MNELIIIAILAIMFLALCLITSIVENFGAICHFVKAVVEVIGNMIKTLLDENLERKRHEK